MIKILIRLILILLIPTISFAATSVTKDDITWNFDDDYTTGQFATGDWYVVAPSGMQIISISNGGSHALGGTEVNPVSGATSQGLSTWTSSGSLPYSSTLDVGDTLPGTPISLSVGDMVVTATLYPPEYYGEPNPDQNNERNYTYIEQGAILTVLASAPAANSFRPGICDSTRTIYSANDINYDLLADLTPASGIMSLSTAVDMVARPWLDWAARQQHSRQIHPNYNMKDYGGEISVDTGTLALILNCNYTDEQKAPIAIGLVQFGLDVWSHFQNDKQAYVQSTAHRLGRKLPMMLAAELLDITAIKEIYPKMGSYVQSNWGSFPSDAYVFSEDSSHSYVNSNHVSVSSGNSYPYTEAMIGMPEWFHYDFNYGISSIISHWSEGTSTSGSYRHCCYSGTLEGAALVARIMGWEGDEWDHDAFFDYIERWVGIADTGTDPFGYTVPGQVSSPTFRGSWQSNGAWMASMYDTYWESCADGACLGSVTGSRAGFAISNNAAGIQITANGSPIGAP
jgi:hypothetical protein